MNGKTWVLVAGVAVWASWATAADAPVTKVQFAARTQGAIVLDAQLDEPAWQTAAVMKDFEKSYGGKVEDSPARTEVRFCWDDRFLYVAAVCDEEADANMRSFLEMASDGVTPMEKRDHLEVRLGRFCCNLGGGTERSVVFRGDYNEDFLLRTPFDGVHYGLCADWDCALKVVGTVWTVEARFARADFDLAPDQSMECPLEVVRVRFGKQALSCDRTKLLPRKWHSYAWNAQFRDPTKAENYGWLSLVEKLPDAATAAAVCATKQGKPPRDDKEADREEFLKLRDEIVRERRVRRPIVLDPPADAPALGTEEPTRQMRPQDRKLPFVPWGKPLARRPRAFICISSWGAYDAWALTNRLDLDARIYQVTGSPWIRTIAPGGDEFKEGRWMYERKRAELVRALKEEGPFDAFLFIGCSPETWPADLQCWLLERMLEGATAVVENDEEGKPFTVGKASTVKGLDLSVPADIVSYVRGDGEDLLPVAKPASLAKQELSFAPFGKGGLWSFQTGRRGGWVHRSQVTPAWPTMPDGLFADEYAFAYAVKAYLHALGLRKVRQALDVSRGLCRTDDAAEASVELHTAGSAFTGTLSWILRDATGAVIEEPSRRAVEFAAGDATTPISVGRRAVGRYTVDVFLRDTSGHVVDFAACALHVRPAEDVGFAEAKLAERLLKTAAEPVIANCTVRGAKAGLSVRGEIRDVRNRVLARAEFPVDPATGAAIVRMPQVRNYDWTCAFLDLTLHAGARKLDARTLPFVRRREKLADFTVFTGGPQMGGYMGLARLAILQHAGIDLYQSDTNPIWIFHGGDLVYRDRIPGSHPEAGGSLTSPWYLAYCQSHFRRDAEMLASVNGRWLSLGDDSRVTWNFPKQVPDFVPVWMEAKGKYLSSRRYAKTWMNDLTNALDAAAVAEWTKAIRTAYPTVARFNRQCGTAIRDWSELSAETLKAIRPAPSPEFCNFTLAMEEKYGDIASLNAAWGTEYASFTNITEKSVASDMRAKSYVAFVDRQRYLEDAFIGQCRAISEAVRSVDPAIGLGFGATNLGNNLADAMKCIDTVCPYAGISPAIEEARALGARFIGETMGIYGGRTVSRAFRERTVWHSLLNGCTFAWFWDASFIGGDLTVEPSRMGWMLETIREVKRGPAALCLRGVRQDDGVRVLLSRDSGHFAFVNDFRTTHEHSGKTFFRTIESLGYQFNAISSEQLEHGGLAGAKMLVLPCVRAISDAEAAAIRAFVAAGGTVVADILPADFDVTGRRLPQSLLADVFGVTREGPALRGVYEDIALKGPSDGRMTLRRALVDASVRAVGAKALGTGAEGSSAFLVNDVGRGRAILLNMHLACLPFLVGNDSTGVSYATLADLFACALGRPEAVLRERSGKVVTGTEFSRFVRGSLAYLGVEKVPHLNEAKGDYPREVTVELSRPRHVYDVRRGRALGEVKSFPMTLEYFHEGLYALLPYRVKAMKLATPGVVRRGESLEVKAELVTEPTVAATDVPVFRVELIPPEGCGPDRLATFPTRVLDAPGGMLTTSYPMAFNDRADAVWTLRVTDAASGVTAEQPVRVE